ncbi:hypothetical protein HOLleu_30288 [Holothuria leucospilota]|uniref:Uncharacterized protein n=1 Tax=Holothuria leucospilota TaxID=206669 RepID=A0A9Q1BK63_HOLLE|nr:hypothetical protein HOLleu_30288 [Holothuria leucospilota]
MNREGRSKALKRRCYGRNVMDGKQGIRLNGTAADFENFCHCRVNLTGGFQNKMKKLSVLFSFLSLCFG